MKLDLLKLFEDRFGPLDENGFYGGDLDLRGYNHALPSGFTGNGGDLDLSDYNHALPSGAKSNTGWWGQANTILFDGEKVLYLPKIFDIPEGDIVVYKKVCRRGLSCIVTLLIPKEAKRVHGKGHRKCRAEYAKTLEISEGLTEVKNTAYKPYVTYRIGEMVYPDKDESSENVECGAGINFFLTKIEAQRY